jgi:hypothetical protein
MTISYATWNPSDKAAELTLSDGNLTAAGSAVDAYAAVRATIGKSTGKWYFEIYFTSKGTYSWVGIADATMTTAERVGLTTYSWGNQSNGQFWHDGYNWSGQTISAGTTVMIALDLDNHKIWWGKDGTWHGGGDPAAGTGYSNDTLEGTLFPALTFYWTGNATANFGASAFAYTVPSGFNSGWYDDLPIVDAGPLAAVSELSGAPGPSIPIPELAVTSSLSVLSVFLGYFISAEPLSAVSGLDADIQIDLLPSGLTVISGLDGDVAALIGLASLAAVSAMSVADVVSFGSSDFVVTYLCKLTPQPGSAYSAITLPMSSFQGRFKSGDPSFLSVVIPGDDYATAISNRHDPDNPPELSVYMVKTCIGGYIISEQLMAVDLEDVKTYEGGTNISIELEGHRTNTYSAKPVSLTGASYKNLTGGKLRYRCQPDLFLRPGDTVTVNGDTFTADSISIAMAVDSQTMEVAEA